MREEYEEAIDDLTRAVELKPTYPDVNNALGIAHFFGGSREMAAQYFNSACEINPGYLEAHLHLAYTLIEIGDVGTGVALLDDFPSLTGGGGAAAFDSGRVSICRLHTRLGEMYERRNELPEALAEYRKAVRIQPGFLDVMLKLARIYARLDLYEDAHREFDRILRMNSEYDEAHMELGLLHLREGNFEEARKHWEKCLGSELHALRARFYLKRLIRGELRGGRERGT